VSVVCGTTAGAADSKISNQLVTFESNRIGIVRFEFESNLEASQVPIPSPYLPSIFSLPYFSLPSPPSPPPLEVSPHCSYGVWGALKFPEWVRAEPGRQTYPGA